MPFIVKRNNPDNNVGVLFQYLDRHNRWTKNSADARVFTGKGHAKSCLVRASKTWRHDKHIIAGDTIFIQPVYFIAKGSPETWVIA